MSREPLPEDVVFRPIAHADALRHGITDRELNGPHWLRLQRGVYVWNPVADETDARIASVAELLPEGAYITGWAGLRMAGVGWLDGLAPDGRNELPVQVCLPPPLNMRPREGVQFLRSGLTLDERNLVNGLPVATPVRCCFDLARRPAIRERPKMLTEAVVAIDAALAFEIITQAEIERYVADRPGWRGLPLLRRAVALSDGHVRSPWESRYRVLWVVEAGLPTPEVNVPIFRRSDSQFLGIVDLWIESCALAGEYDGSGHREAERHAADNAREEDLEHVGATVTRAGYIDLTRDRHRTVTRTGAAYHAALIKDPRLADWTTCPPLGWTLPTSPPSTFTLHTRHSRGWARSGVQRESRRQ